MAHFENNETTMSKKVCALLDKSWINVEPFFARKKRFVRLVCDYFTLKFGGFIAADVRRIAHDDIKYTFFVAIAANKFTQQVHFAKFDPIVNAECFRVLPRHIERCS